MFQKKFVLEPLDIVPPLVGYTEEACHEIRDWMDTHDVSVVLTARSTRKKKHLVAVKASAGGVTVHAVANNVSTAIQRAFFMLKAYGIR